MSQEEEEKIVVVEKQEKEEERITKKDPKKVEQGRKLAMISKEAKERKMRQKN